jgi:hypothetical protein
MSPNKKQKKRTPNTSGRRNAPDFRIPLPTRLERKRFLIVCEGKNTEPDYFNHFRQYFRLSALEIITIPGAGETIRVVERAQKEAVKSSFDQIWVVFDKDDFPAVHFDNAIKIAESQGYGVAYSNQAFEYWLILHFEGHQGGAMHRSLYKDKINSLLKPLKLSYNATGSKSISTEFFQVLMDNDPQTGESRLNLAIKRAKRIHTAHEHHHSAAAAESSTTVFKLVEEILKFT